MSKKLEEIHKSFGRHTDVGKLLYQIYNVDKNTYKPNVRLKLRPSDPNAEHEQKLKKERELSYNTTISSCFSPLIFQFYFCLSVKERKNKQVSQPYKKPDDNPAPKINNMRGRKPQQTIVKEIKTLYKPEKPLYRRMYSTFIYFCFF